MLIFARVLPDFRQRLHLLGAVNVRKTIELTPKAKKLYYIARNLRKISKKLFVKNASNNERIAAAVEFAHSEDFFKQNLN